ncbi:MAG: aldehyde-activating protein [Alphaproteobacteria bacterium]|nr:aldehyde-activating protein [Alphaproteobacteria bacterium]
MTVYRGGCHCGNIRVAFETGRAPGDFTPQACQCGFCRKHGTAALSDPDGKLTFTIEDPDNASLYRHGLGLTDFIICRTCGVYVGAHMPDPKGDIANVMVNALDDRERFTNPPQPVVRTEEDEESKRVRRRRQWTPSTIVTGSG